MREHVPSGRPQAGEYADYAEADIAAVAGDDIVSILRQQALETLSLFGDLGEERIRGLTYAPGKWTMKEIRLLSRICGWTRVQVERQVYGIKPLQSL